MPKKLTITVDAEVYDGLHSIIGRRRISRFLNDLARPHVVGQDLSAGYAAMALDEARETGAGGMERGGMVILTSPMSQTVMDDPVPRRAARRLAPSPSIHRSAAKFRRPGRPWC